MTCRVSQDELNHDTPTPKQLAAEAERDADKMHHARNVLCGIGAFDDVCERVIDDRFGELKNELANILVRGRSNTLIDLFSEEAGKLWEQNNA